MNRYSKSRQQKQREPGTLKAVIARLVSACSGLVSVAELIGKSKSQVQRYTDEAYPDTIHIDDVILLERARGDMIVSGFMAHEQGAAPLKLPSGGRRSRIDADFAHVGQRIALLFEAYGREVERNGTVEPADERVKKSEGPLGRAACALRLRAARALRVKRFSYCHERFTSS
jgi:hypothetical protein